LGDPRAPVPDVAVPKACGGVEVASPRGVPDVRPLAAHQHQLAALLDGGHVSKRMPVAHDTHPATLPAITAPTDDRPAAKHLLRLVRKVRLEPTLGFSEAFAFPPGVVLDLVLADPSDVEVPSLRMAEVDAGHARRRRHRAARGEVQAHV